MGTNSKRIGRALNKKDWRTSFEQAFNKRWDTLQQGLKQKGYEPLKKTSLEKDHILLRRP